MLITSCTVWVALNGFRRNRDYGKKWSGKTSQRRWDLNWDFEYVEKLNRHSEKSIPGRKEWFLSAKLVGREVYNGKSWYDWLALRASWCYWSPGTPSLANHSKNLFKTPRITLLSWNPEGRVPFSILLLSFSQPVLNIFMRKSKLAMRKMVSWPSESCGYEKASVINEAACRAAQRQDGSSTHSESEQCPLELWEAAALMGRESFTAVGLI